MTENTKNTAPQKNSDEQLKSDDKQARLAEALRANLRRRKAQARDRRDTGGE